MEIKCEYCGSMIEDTLPECPNCGAPNDNMRRTANSIPKTIEELKIFCRAKNLNLEKMHFYIGQDYSGAKAFGIYQESNGEFVVYKNKSDGSRAVRYRGRDEAYAVNEIYQKLRSQIQEAREYNANKTANPIRIKRDRINFSNLYVIIILAIFVVISIFVILVSVISNGVHRGYYSYNGNSYYHSADGWYILSDDNYWYSTTVDDNLDENYKDYFVEDYSGYEFDKYEQNDDWDDDEWDNDWDDDFDWDTDDDWDWDTGTDWDSDW